MRSEGILLLNIDCVEFMKTCKDNQFDLAICDPPYGIGLDTWDFVKPTDEYFEQLFRVSKNQIIWGGNYFAHQLPITESWLCWNKRPFLKQQAHFELAWTSFEIKPRLYDYTYAGNAEGINNIKVDYNKKSIHPAQKPINIYNLLLNDFAQKGMKLLDTHLGSANIAIACHYFGVELTGCEIDKQIYLKAVKNYETNTVQTKLF